MCGHSLIIEHIDIHDIQRIHDFIENAGDSLRSFRYFESRPLTVIENHLVTLIASLNSKPIGYAHLDYEEGIYWLGIAVNNEFKGKGIGKKLMSEIIKCAIRSNVRRIQLSVDFDNQNAIKLYEKFGFRMDVQKSGTCFYSLEVQNNV